jgi:hypothetical protein
MVKPLVQSDTALPEISMKRSVCLALVLMALLSIAATACSEAAGDYYENDTHGGYPGPGTRTNNRE